MTATKVARHVGSKPNLGTSTVVHQGFGQKKLCETSGQAFKNSRIPESYLGQYFSVSVLDFFWASKLAILWSFKVLFSRGHSRIVEGDLSLTG